MNLESIFEKAFILKLCDSFINAHNLRNHTQICFPLNEFGNEKWKRLLTNDLYALFIRP